MNVMNVVIDQKPEKNSYHFDHCMIYKQMK